MKIFVTGATGALGSHTVPALIRAGHTVTALARNPAKAAALRAQGAEPVTVSLFDRDGLAEVFIGHDAVANLATALPPSSKFLDSRAWAENARVRTEGSAAVAAAAGAAGVDRLLQESVCMIYRDRADRWIDEQWATDDFPLARTNHAAEANTQQFMDAGGTGVVLRFGLFYGPESVHSREFLTMAHRGIAPMFGRGDSFVSSIHLADAGEAVAAALEVPAGVYNVVDDHPITKYRYADAIAHAAGRTHYLRVPGRLAELLGARTTSLTRSLRVSNAKFREATRWSPSFPSATDGWAAFATHTH
ncbi:NAD-dependent epimerase/dehydratase family protein [Nocardia flavorosea]|uniref:NAD-dependent epimerase/dehydratase family protein n=1 Tax=Nocardia flavorosea TaxID=53429 RepID=UPI0024560213|nr:NAD(P)-dependent oxidoreductase [Nocardia flavorosea]